MREIVMLEVGTDLAQQAVAGALIGRAVPGKHAVLIVDQRKMRLRAGDANSLARLYQRHAECRCSLMRDCNGLVLDLIGLELQSGLIAVLGIWAGGGRRKDAVRVAEIDLGVTGGRLLQLQACGRLCAIVREPVDIAEKRCLRQIDRRRRLFLDEQHGIKKLLRHCLSLRGD